MDSAQFSENNKGIILFGRGRLASSIAVCLAASGSDILFVSENTQQDGKRTRQHIEDLSFYSSNQSICSIRVADKPDPECPPYLAVITGYFESTTIHSIIRNLESTYSPGIIIAVATDHIPLKELQKNTSRPDHILVMNWAEPAHATFFLEIVHNEITDPEIVSRLQQAAIKHWGKDPYIIASELGVRGRMMAAMIREAMYLVEEEYAHVDDIDRACRNDAGTYMPFAGNFQYMDLMGSYAYGVVMEKLNKELSNATNLAPFFDQILQDDLHGMENGHGLYEYSMEDVDDWVEKMRYFSFEVRELMKKYPFGYLGNEKLYG